MKKETFILKNNFITNKYNKMSYVVVHYMDYQNEKVLSTERYTIFPSAIIKEGDLFIHKGKSYLITKIEEVRYTDLCFYFIACVEHNPEKDS